jgi:hypothetical protein
MRAVKELEPKGRELSWSLNLSVLWNHVRRWGAEGFDVNHGSIPEVDIAESVQREGTISVVAAAVLREVVIKTLLVDRDGRRSIARTEVDDIEEEGIVEVEHTRGGCHDLLWHVQTLGVHLPGEDERKTRRRRGGEGRREGTCA